MIHLSQNSAFSRVVPSSARSSTPATTSSISAPAMPLTTYSAHASAMPIFLAMNAFPSTYSPTFLLTSGQMFPYSIPTFTLPPTLPTAVLPVPPTTPVLPIANSSPVSGTSSSSSSSADVLPIPPSTAGLPIASSSPVSSASTSSSSSRSVKLTTTKLLKPKFIINHARNSLRDKALKRWTPLEERQLVNIQKNHERYLKENTHWIEVAAQTLKRSTGSVYRKFMRLQEEQGSS